MRCFFLFCFLNLFIDGCCSLPGIVQCHIGLRAFYLLSLDLKSPSFIFSSGQTPYVLPHLSSPFHAYYSIVSCLLLSCQISCSSCVSYCPILHFYTIYWWQSYLFYLFRHLVLVFFSISWTWGLAFLFYREGLPHSRWFIKCCMNV